MENLKLINTANTPEVHAKGALKALGLTQKSFAALMGVSEQTVSAWSTSNEFPKYATEYLKLQIDANILIDSEKRIGKDALKRHMDSIITERNYIDNVSAIVDVVWEYGIELFEDDNGAKPESEIDVLEMISYYGIDHEQVDQDSWMIYPRFHSAICQHSRNAEAYGDIGIELTGDFANITQTVAFYAMLQDVNDALHDKEL